MKALHLLSLSILFMTAPIIWADPIAIASSSSTDPLAEALPILEAKYAGFKDLNFKPGDRVSDLIARSSGGISLVTPDSVSGSSTILTAVLPGDVIYWRLSSFTPKTTWSDLAESLAQANPAPTGVVLDLRSNLEPDDYSGAAQVLAICSPADMTLSKLGKGTSDNPGVKPVNQGIHFPIVVLTNNQTSGAAEALAACLKKDGALVVGRPTAGRLGIFEEQKLSTGQLLRYFVAPILPLGSLAETKLRPAALPWNQPVVPDIVLTVNDKVEKMALILIRDNHVQEVIQESAKRDRMSEASLVEGQDPEWNAYLDSMEKKPDDHYRSLPPARDVALISALDSLKAIRLSQRAVPSPARVVALPPAAGTIQ